MMPVTTPSPYPMLAMMCALMPPVTASSSESVVAPDPLEWKFKVFLDQRDIGTHTFRLSKEGETKTLVTKAEFDVRILFFNAFRYRHDNTEVWDQDGLVSIDANTLVNRDQSLVRGQREGDQFELQAGGGNRTLSADIMSFAYWNPAILEQSQLLNSQTGELETVEVIDRGESTVTYNGNDIPARRFDLMVKGTPISVWYHATDQRWIGLQSTVKGGRILRYEPLSLPPEPIESLHALNLTR